jgi:hypothetical protein
MDVGNDVDRVDLGDSADVEQATYGRRVRVGVARAEFLDQLLRDPRMTSVVDALTSVASADAVVRKSYGGGDVIAFVSEQAQGRLEGRARGLEAMTAIAQKLGITWMGPWLVEFLVAAVDFRVALAELDLGACTLTDPSLARARAYIRSWTAWPDPRSSSPTRPPALRHLAALIPEVEPTAWLARPPDWIELSAMLVEHASERLDWTEDPTPAGRWWLYELLSSFVMDLEPGDDPEVLHGLVGLWANSCHGLIDKHTQTRLPRGQVPDHSGFYADGQAREGRRDKTRRWVGWYLDREVRGVALNDILRAAFAYSHAPLARSTELNRCIREAKSLLTHELPLDAGQPLRLWNLAQEDRSLLEEVWGVALENGLARP